MQGDRLGGGRRRTNGGDRCAGGNRRDRTFDLGNTDLWLTAEESRTPTCDQTNYGKPAAEQKGGAQPHPRRDSIAETGGASASI